MTVGTTAGRRSRAHRHPTAELPERLAYPVPEAAQLLGVGVTKVRELIRSGELRHVRVARRLLVPRRAIEDFLGRLMEAS